MLNTTFNNISVISWPSVLLVDYLEKTTDLSQITDKQMLYRVHLAMSTGLELTTLVVIGNDCKGSCKSNYYTSTTTTAPCSIKGKQWTCGWKH